MSTILVNRLHEQLELMFDGRPVVFEPGEERKFDDDVMAKHLRKRSLVKDNPITGEGVFALARKGIDPVLPLQRPTELLDRSDMGAEAQNVEYVEINNPIKKGADVGGPMGSALDEFQFASEKAAAKTRRV
jgi:hypothetical protein